MRLSPLLSVVAAESAGRRELECQLQFTIRKLHILHKHAAHEIERVNNTSATVSPAAEVENRRIQSFVMSAKANLNRVRQSAATAQLQLKRKRDLNRLRGGPHNTKWTCWSPDGTWRRWLLLLRCDKVKGMDEQPLTVNKLPQEHC